MQSDRLLVKIVWGMFVFLCFSIKGMAQKSVEKLSSDEDVVKFVKSYFSQMENPDPIWKSFQLVDGNEWKGLYNLNRQLEDSLSRMKVVKWQTADFNLDKQPDLVVCGKLPHGAGNEYVLLAFMSGEDGNYNAKPLVPSGYESYPYYFSLMLLPKIAVPAIRLVKWFPDINNESPNGYPFTVDTIGFAQEYLVNYNAHPDSALFKKIQFESSGDNGARTTVTIENLDKGVTSPFTIISYSNPNDSTVVHGKITLEIYAELLSLVNYSGFKEMPDQYQSNTSFPQTYYVLEAAYADGTTKKLKDFSGGGTYSLAAVYSWFSWLIKHTDEYVRMRNYERSINR